MIIENREGSPMDRIVKTVEKDETMIATAMAGMIVTAALVLTKGWDMDPESLRRVLMFGFSCMFVAALYNVHRVENKDQ